MLKRVRGLLKAGISNLTAYQDNELQRKLDKARALTRQYGAELLSNLHEMERQIKAEAVFSDWDGQYLMRIENLDLILDDFLGLMKGSARRYFPKAIAIGRDYMGLFSKSIKEGIREADLPHRQTIYGDILSYELAWNDDYLEQSLVPDLEARIRRVEQLPYNYPEEGKRQLSMSLSKVNSRIEQYAGAIWKVTEGSIKRYGEGENLLVHWIGASDERSCFLAGTEVITEDAVKLIEEIRVGEKVLTFKGNMPSTYGWREVEKTFKRQYNGKIIKVETENGRIIECTSNHPILLDNWSFKLVGMLTDKDRVMCCIWGSERKFHFSLDTLLLKPGRIRRDYVFDFMLNGIKKITKRDYQGKVYNLKVEGDKNYIANRIVVHNCDECLDAFAGNPYLLEEAPSPGDQKCDGFCRHALQIVGVKRYGE